MNEVVPCGPYVGCHMAPKCWSICFEIFCEFMGFDLENSGLRECFEQSGLARMPTGGPCKPYYILSI
jgi:hypothetical protein